MKRPIIAMRVGAILLAAWLWLAPVAFAHGGPSRLELSVEQINPGGTLEVRGINLAPGQPVAVVLLGAEAETPPARPSATTKGTSRKSSRCRLRSRGERTACGLRTPTA